MAEPHRSVVRLWRSIRRSDLLLPMLVVAAVVVPLNLLHVARIASISPIDELMHIDYLIRAAEPGFQRMSDQFSQEAMHEIACRRHPTDPLPPCDVRPYVPEDFYWQGRNVASSHSPWYYIVTGVPARLLRWALPGDSTVTWARALGSVWLMGGLGMVLSVARRLGLRPWTVVPALALVGLSPAVQHASTTVNPDATAIFAGGLLAWVGVRTGEGSLPPWTLLPATAVAYSLDSGNILAAVAVAMFLSATFLFLKERRNQIRRISVPVLMLFGGIVIGSLAQSALLNGLGIVDYVGSPQERMFSVGGLAGPIVWGEDTVFALLPPTKGYVFPALDTPAHRVFAALATLVTTVGIVAGATSRIQHFEVRAAALAALATLLIAGPLLTVVNYLQIGWYFPIPARYGLSVVPFVVAAVASTFGWSRPGRAAMWVIVGGLGLTTIAAIG